MNMKLILSDIQELLFNVSGVVMAFIVLRKTPLVFLDVLNEVFSDKNARVYNLNYINKMQIKQIRKHVTLKFRWQA